MKDILVWHQGALGDLLLSLPAVYSIKKHFAPCRLHLISRTDLAGVIVASGIADEVSSNEKAMYADFFREDSLPTTASEFLRKMHAAFVFMKRRDRTFMKNLRKHVPFCRSVSTVPQQGERVHVAAFQLGELLRAGISSYGTPRLCVAPPAGIGGGRPYVTIHPGSGGKWKRWNLRGFADVMDALAEVGSYRFLVLLGPAERGMREECGRLISTRNIPADIVGDRPIPYIASLLAMSSLFVGSDSGITHLASMIGTPSVAIFGPTDPELWGPLGPGVRIVKSGCTCCPCSEAASLTCPEELRCLKDVKPQDVLKAAHELLSEDCRKSGVRGFLGS
ncbi:MAG: glycosyltransferase family 9 protein [Nitrospiraceae bacterium]|nr:glycosyltransferase family 9 protein [Nitrospiraceae bacterium]